MATTFPTATITATAIPQAPPYQHHVYRKSTQYSPSPTSTTTPNTSLNVSPTSPRTTQLALPRHQGIYQPRTAIGVPAALRKTAKPGKNSPPRIDSGLASPTNTWSVNGPFGPNIGAGCASPVSQIAHGDMLNAYSDVPLSPVAGPITRNHWQADTSTLVCSASSCQEPFSFFQRRHHCRKCGGIFCWQHSANKVCLDELARFHPDGNLHRACDRCHSSFREWEHLRSSRNNSQSSGSSVIAIDTPAPTKGPDNPRLGSIAQSFQGAWNWSTF